MFEDEFLDLLYKLTPTDKPIENYDSPIYPLQIVKSFETTPRPDEFCRICGEQQYHEPTILPEWVQCENCSCWVHICCDGIFNQQLLQESTYYCPFCRILLNKMHPCNENDALARDPRIEVEPKKNQCRQKRERPAKSKEEKTQSEVTQQIDKESLLEEFNCVVGPEQQGKEISPQELLLYIKSAFFALKQEVLPVFKNSIVRCQQEQMAIKNIDTQNDDCVAENILSLFFREYCEAQGQDVKPEDAEKFYRQRVRELLSRRGGQPINLRLNQKLFMPVMPSDAELRVRMTEVAFGSMVEHVEQLRFAYVKSILPEVARAALIYRELQDGEEPGARTLNQQPIYDYFSRVFDQSATPDLSLGGYLPAEKLLSKSAKTAHSPPKITKRQWFDMTERGVKEFSGITIIRQTLLLACVQVGLGANVFDRVFSEELTNMCIQFGLSSAKNLAVRLCRHDSACSNPGCPILQPELCDHEFLDVKCLCGIKDDEKVGEKEDIEEDSQIEDWDILETPTSVCWGLKLIDEMLESGDL